MRVCISFTVQRAVDAQQYLCTHIISSSGGVFGTSGWNQSLMGLNCVILCQYPP